MANDSSFTGDALCFNKTLKNTPENRIKMQGLLTAYLDISNNYYGSFEEVYVEDLEFNLKSDYVETISRSFFSSGRWTYESSFNYLLDFNKEKFDDEIEQLCKADSQNKEKYEVLTFDDFIGFGISVMGTDYEPGCHVLYEFYGESQIIGTQDDKTIYNVPDHTIKNLPFTSENINDAVGNIEMFDFSTYYGIRLFFEKIFTDYLEDGDDNYKYVMQLMPVAGPIIINYLGFNLGIYRSVIQIASYIFLKYIEDYNYEYYELEVTFEKDEIHIGDVIYEEDIVPILKDIEAAVKKYISKKELKKHV